MKWNLGCGFDIKEGWFNTNHFSHEPVDGAVYMDILKEDPAIINQIDYILINHVFCVMSYEEVKIALNKIHKYLKDGAVIEVIDFDILKAYDNREANCREAFPGFKGSIDELFCKSIVGYGRKSIYTPMLMSDKLKQAGFKDVKIHSWSEYDIRPLESLIIKAIK